MVIADQCAAVSHEELFMQRMLNSILKIVLLYWLELTHWHKGTASKQEG